MKQLALISSVVLVSAPFAGAVVTWVGGSSTDFWDDANWDFTGSSLTGAEFNPLSPVLDDIQMTGATGITVTTDQGIRIGDGFTLTLSGSDLLVNGAAANSGIAGVAGNGASTVALNTGSFINTQFVTIGIDVVVDGTSSIQFRGGGDPVNGQTERSGLILSGGSQVTFPTQAEFLEQATLLNSYITVNGTAVDGTNIDSLFTFAGGGPVTGTAVPEPGSLLLLGLSGLLLRRRR